MLKYNGGKAHAEVWQSSSFYLSFIHNVCSFAWSDPFIVIVQAKLKSALQLQDLLDATRILVPRAR